VSAAKRLYLRVVVAMAIWMALVLIGVVLGFV